MLREALVDNVATLGMRFLMCLIRSSPRKLGLAISRGCISVLRLAMHRIDGVGLRNLELVFPDKSQEERQKILDKSYLVLASNIYHFSKIPDLTKAKASQAIDFSKGIELLEDVKRRNPGTGILIPCLHFGSFEALVQYYTLLYQPMSFLVRGFGLPKLDAWWNQKRESFGSRMFFRKGGYAEVVKRLAEGDNVGILFDQNVKSNHAVFIDFFGIKASATKAIGLAALRTGAPIIFATSVDHGDGTHSLICKEVENPTRLDCSAEDKVRKVTQDLHRLVEEVIRMYPEQWFWIHRRFKTRPPGEPENMY